MNRILFVDDEPRILQGLQRMLRPLRNEWDMHFAAGGEEALKILSGSEFHVIVTDMRMPVMDGAQLLTLVQERHPGMIRMVLSGHTEEKVALSTIRVAHQFLSKPSNADQLRDVVARALRLQDLLADKKLREIVAGMDSLPALPEVYVKLTEKLADPDCALKEVADIVEQDVAICAKLLQIVNSAFFGLAQSMTNVHQTVSYLGSQMVRNVALSIGVFEGLPVSARKLGLSEESLQQHAMLVGAVAGKIHPDKETADEAFMAGILHDVGKLILGSRLTGDYLEVLAAAQAEGLPVHELETQRLGVSHAEVGAYLLGIWGLPYPIVEAVANHHHPWRLEGRELDLAGVTYLADRLATDGLAETSEAERDYLAALGVEGRLAEWRELTAQLSGAATPVS